MAPIIIASLISAGVQIIGGIISGNQQDAANEAMNARLAEIMAKFNALEIPSIEKQRLILEEVKSVGLYTPELEEIIKLGPSAWEKIAIPPELKADQYATLEALDAIIEGGGLNKSDEARLLNIADKTAAKASGRRDRTAQSFRERGMAGSGFEIQQQIAGAQAEAQAEAVQAREVEARAEERALQAIIARGKEAGGLRQQEYNEQSDLARSRDSVDRFNTEALMNREKSRVANENQARKFNLNRNQEIANKNVGIRNTEQQYNKELIRKHYQDQYNKLRSSLGFEQTASQNQYKQDMSAAQGTMNLYGGLGDLVNTGGQYLQNQSNTAQSQAWKEKQYKLTGKWPT